MTWLGHRHSKMIQHYCICTMTNCKSTWPVSANLEAVPIPAHGELEVLELILKPEIALSSIEKNGDPRVFGLVLLEMETSPQTFQSNPTYSVSHRDL